jgi:GDP-4-dehydro-6-deoxy-D-mannose reductase
MRLVVTGIGGFVAPHLVRELESHGHTVWGAGLTASPDAALPPDRMILGDLGRPGHWDRVLGESEPQAVIHLASQSNPALSWEIPHETFDANVILTIELVQAAARLAHPPRILYVSSSDVYGIPPGGEPLTEASQLNPMNPYGVSKIAAESCARLYGARLGVDVLIARPFSHTGPGQTPRFVVPAFARQVALAECGKAERIEHGDLRSHRDFLNVADVVRAYRLLVETPSASGIYNICSGRSVEIASILKALCAMAKSPVATHFDERRARGEKPSVVHGDFARLHSATGWAPSIALEETLRAVLDEQREHAASAPNAES